MPIEIEARFRADGPRALDRLRDLDQLGPATLGTPTTIDEVDVYLDTADGAFAAARWAARLRTREGRYRISLKGPPEEASSETWLHRRPEVEGPASAEADPASWPPSEARDLVESIARGAAMRERFTLLQRRTERGVRIGASAFGTLTLDTVTVERLGERVGTLEIVELELAADGGRAPHAEELLGRVAAAMASIPGLAPEPRTKLEHALALIDPR